MNQVKELFQGTYTEVPICEAPELLEKHKPLFVGRWRRRDEFWGSVSPVRPRNSSRSNRKWCKFADTVSLKIIDSQCVSRVIRMRNCDEWSGKGTASDGCTWVSGEDADERYSSCRTVIVVAFMCNFDKWLPQYDEARRLVFLEGFDLPNLQRVNRMSTRGCLKMGMVASCYNRVESKDVGDKLRSWFAAIASNQIHADLMTTKVWGIT